MDLQAVGCRDRLRPAPKAEEVDVNHRLGTTLLCAALVVAACDTAGTTRSNAPATTVPPTTTTTAVPDAAGVFETVSPAIAFVETGIATGSGVLIERDLLLTAAHVVWPERDVRVVFPNGESTDSAHVIGRDLMADLALVDVGDILNQPEPANLGNGEELPIGSTVYMVGYPAEPERNPQPTISEGILSRTREWRSQDWTFLQSDAAVVGGQSGGALVDEYGNVIGITNFQLATEYGISGSITDITDRITTMRTGTLSAGTGDRLPPNSGADETQWADIAHYWDQAVFTFEAPLFSEVEFRTKGDTDTAIELMTIDGFDVAFADDNLEGGETAVGQVNLGGIHLAVITSFSADEALELVVGSVEMIPWEDPDDGTVLTKPDELYGNLDFPGDVDWFWLELGNGQSVTIEVDTVTVDPAVYIDSLSNVSEFSLAFDDDSGGGPFGSNPRVVFTAEATDTYLVIVTDDYRTGPGAYLLTVE